MLVLACLPLNKANPYRLAQIAVVLNSSTRLRNGAVFHMAAVIFEGAFSCMGGLLFTPSKIHTRRSFVQELYWIPRFFSRLVKNRCRICEILTRVARTRFHTRSVGVSMAMWTVADFIDVAKLLVKPDHSTTEVGATKLLHCHSRDSHS